MNVEEFESIKKECREANDKERNHFMKLCKSMKAKQRQTEDAKELQELMMRNEQLYDLRTKMRFDEKYCKMVVEAIDARIDKVKDEIMDKCKHRETKTESDYDGHRTRWETSCVTCKKVL
jgi:hypothetical protein